jgi:isopenicillin N synthase-like dioxygenase
VFARRAIQRFDPKLTDGVFEQAKRFFKLPMEKKLEVDTNLVPKEYVGYHAMASYNKASRKHNGTVAPLRWGRRGARSTRPASSLS